MKKTSHRIKNNILTYVTDRAWNLKKVKSTGKSMTKKTKQPHRKAVRALGQVVGREETQMAIRCVRREQPHGNQGDAHQDCSGSPLHCLLVGRG